MVLAQPGHAIFRTPAPIQIVNFNRIVIDGYVSEGITDPVRAVSHTCS
jgi:hypothetical protein